MDMADMEHLAMEDTDITTADMVIMMDTAMDRAHMAMETMEKKVKMTLLAMIMKKLAKTMMDIAMETVGTVRRADMTMETVDIAMETVGTVRRADMTMETV